MRMWAKGRGKVGTEWRFYLLPPDEKPSSLVPDIAYVSSARIASVDEATFQKTPFAPDIAVEILSPVDRAALLEAKISLYLGNGGSLVIVVDPKRQTIRMIDKDTDRTFSDGDVARSEVIDDFSIVVKQLFEENA
jgi:Uma2 family endonuclease